MPSVWRLAASVLLLLVGRIRRYMESQGQVSTVTTSLYERFVGAIGDGNATALSMQRKMKVGCAAWWSP